MISSPHRQGITKSNLKRKKKEEQRLDTASIMGRVLTGLPLAMCDTTYHLIMQNYHVEIKN